MQCSPRSRRDQPPQTHVDLSAPAILAGSLPSGPPPGPAGAIGTNHGPNRAPHLTNNASESGSPPMACDTVQPHIKYRSSHDLANVSSPMDHHEPPSTLTHRSTHEP
ncbi:pentatricopeptide repeat-containing protein chloroplastic [Dorcoceras hygrometricum]|uniref:Pentatricopeptide repeat-containing protein chloroplastic n=1 Tax=Dorcoceras hygrometricum TaxID=472368 RepID=A0A2Z7DFG7_9LAMI|nr:pentatricopeptide repeat-containing protein chloroplastic [Dorcoceras hygrometricum]